MKIKRIVVEVNSKTGKIDKQYDLDLLMESEKKFILQIIFSEGLKRLGYTKISD